MAENAVVEGGIDDEVEGGGEMAPGKNEAEDKDKSVERGHKTVGLGREFSARGAISRRIFARRSIGIAGFVGHPGDGLEARTAETGRLGGTVREAGQERAGHDDPLAPARPLVEMALGDPAGVVVAAKRTAFIPAEVGPIFDRERFRHNVLHSTPGPALGLRNRDAALAHVFPGAVGIGGFADFVGAEKEDLGQPFPRVDAGGQRGGVRNFEGDVALPIPARAA